MEEAVFRLVLLENPSVMNVQAQKVLVAVDDEIYESVAESVRDRKESYIEGQNQGDQNTHKNIPNGQMSYIQKLSFHLPIFLQCKGRLSVSGEKNSRTKQFFHY